MDYLTAMEDRMRQREGTEEGGSIVPPQPLPHVTGRWGGGPTLRAVPAGHPERNAEVCGAQSDEEARVTGCEILGGLLIDSQPP